MHTHTCARTHTQCKLGLNIYAHGSKHTLGPPPSPRCCLWLWWTQEASTQWRVSRGCWSQCPAHRSTAWSRKGRQREQHLHVSDTIMWVYTYSDHVCWDTKQNLRKGGGFSGCSVWKKQICLCRHFSQGTLTFFRAKMKLVWTLQSTLNSMNTCHYIEEGRSTLTETLARTSLFFHMLESEKPHLFSWLCQWRSPSFKTKFASIIGWIHNHTHAHGCVCCARVMNESKWRCQCTVKMCIPPSLQCPTQHRELHSPWQTFPWCLSAVRCYWTAPPEGCSQPCSDTGGGRKGGRRKKLKARALAVGVQTDNSLAETVCRTAFAAAMLSQWWL